MRILIFSELIYPHGSGAELATWLYMKLLAMRGFRITVVTRRFQAEPSVEFRNNVKIVRIPMRIIRDSRYSTLINVGTLATTYIRRLIKDNDVIYIPGMWYSVIPVAKLFKKPVVVHLHNYSIVCPTSLMYNFVTQNVNLPSSSKIFILHEIIEKKRKLSTVILSSLMNETIGRHYNRLGLEADALIFVSRAQRDLILSRIKNIKRKSYVIYNPIPQIPFIEAQERGLGYFGGKSFVKGFYILLQALKYAKFLKTNNIIKVYMTRISEAHKTIKINSKTIINFLPKIESLSNIMHNLTVVAIPSIWPEPLPYTLIESMMYGKLVIASSVGGIPEIVNGVNRGMILVKPGDYEELAEAIVSFHDIDLREANEIGMSLREFIFRRFNNEKIVNSFIKILEGLS